MGEREFLETVYNILNWLVLPFWVLIIVLPNWKPVSFIIRTKIVTMFYGIAYVTMMILAMFLYVPVTEKVGEFVANANNTETGGMFGPSWFFFGIDFLSGCWIVEDGRKAGMPQILIAIACGLTLAYGPTGVMVYFLMRLFFVRSIQKELEYKHELENPKWLPNFKIFGKEVVAYIFMWIGTPDFWIHFLFLDKCGVVKPKEKTKNVVEPEEKEEKEEEEGEGEENESTQIINK